MFTEISRIRLFASLYDMSGESKNIRKFVEKIVKIGKNMGNYNLNEAKHGADTDAQWP